MAGPLAVIGAGLGIFSGITGAIGANDRRRAQQKAANARAKFEKEMAEWSWDDLRDRERWSQHQVDIARINEASIRHFTDQMRWDEYNRKLYIKDYNYKSQVEEYNQSELEYAQQIDYNAMGAQLAREEQQVWLNEQLEQAAFQTEDLYMTTQKQYDDIALELARGRDVFDLLRSSTNLQHRAKSAEFAGKSIEAMIKTLEAKGKARARGQAGRTARKTVQAIGAIADFQQSMLNDMATKSEQAFSQQQEQNQAQYQNLRAKNRIERAFVDKQFDLGKRKIQSSRTSAFNAHQANMLRIEYDKYGADMQAESRRQSPPPAYDELPEVPPPYFMPQTYIPDAYKTEKKPPGPVGAPNLMAGSGLTFASNIIGSLASAANTYASMQQTPIGGGGNNSYGGTGPSQQQPGVPIYGSGSPWEGPLSGAHPNSP